MPARQRTLLQLLEDLRQAVDMPAFTTTSYITKAQATRWLNESAHSFARQYASFGLYSKTTTFNAVNGTKEYAFATIAPDFACLQNLIYPVSGEPVRIRRASDVDQIDLQSQTAQGWQSGSALYLVLGEVLLLTDPKASFTVTMRYVPELPVYNAGGTAIGDFSADTDYILEKGNIAQWLVYDSAMKAQIKQQIDPGPMMAMRDDIGLALKPTTLDRDVHNSDQVRKTWGDYDYTGDVRRGGGYF